MNEITCLKNDFSFQISIHKCSKSLKSQLSFIFPFLSLNDFENLLILPTLQHSKEDLITIGEVVETEKERLLINVQIILFF